MSCKPEKDPAVEARKDWTAYRVAHLVRVQPHPLDGDESVDSLQLTYTAAGKLDRINEVRFSRHLISGKIENRQEERHQLVYAASGRLQEIRTDWNQRSQPTEPNQWTSGGRMLCDYDAAGRLVNLTYDFQSRQEKLFHELGFAPQGQPTRIVTRLKTPEFTLQYDARGNAVKTRQLYSDGTGGYERTFTFDANPNPFRLLSGAGLPLLIFFRDGGDLGWNYQYAITSQNNPLTIRATSLGGMHGPLLNPNLTISYRYNPANLPLEARVVSPAQALRIFRFYYE
ncbi:hypothetical protein [Tellurirhabdus rosea]|uniref:hypothetical protein n=1 Tax=Tellurirhabdus rosea TaxID=2674997 RepID=UPI00224F351A|nr:hypothetical protein [Tellurirhabdus rosea]